ncbi:MAG: lysophospholipid acyltransferase family protein [Candidatus Omnitrophica bacterium]|nr:lysophospholipid acyltransferase family protein [Candidatus Omnitrophota bacterium]
MFDYILYKIGQFIVLHLPLKMGYKIAVFISDLHYLFAAEDRLNVTENLKAIFPEKSDREIHSIRIRMFRNFAKYLVDFLCFSKMNMQYLKSNIKVEDIHYLDDALSKGKGVIALSAHLGNWELGAAAIATLGYPIWVVALTHKHKQVNNLFNLQRQSKGVGVIPLGMAVRQCLELFGKNEIIALVGDRDFNERGAVVDFFGRPTFFPVGPAGFALKTQASIVPVFIFRNKDDTFTLKFEKPIECAWHPDTKEGHISKSDKDKQIMDLIRRYKVIIEGYIRKYPDQWFMFRRFWIS